MFTATLYNKTGFTLLNIPDSEATLQAAATSTKAVPAMDILQLLYNTNITIKAFENDVMYADYMKLTDDDNHKSAFYVINGYTMTSGDTIQLNITMEAILTGGGIAAITSDDCIIDGIVTRHMLPVRDTVWKELAQASNEEDPLFTPVDPTSIELVGKIFGNPHDETTGNIYVITSVDVDAANSFRYDIETSSGLQTYVDANLVTGDAINYEIPGKYDDVTYQTSPSTPSGPAMGAYTGQVTVISTQNQMIDFRKKLVALIANKMTGIVTDAYMAPMKWVTPQSSQHIIGQKYAEFINIDNYLPLGVDELAIQGYLGKYNEYIFVASASGNVKEMPIQQMHLSTSGGNVRFVMNGMADPRPNGGVDFAIGEKGNTVNGVGVIKGKYDILKGGTWYHVQLDALGANGASYNLRQFNAERTSKDISAYANAVFGIESRLNAPGGDTLSNPQGDINIPNPLYAMASIKDAITSSQLSNYIDESGNINYGAALAGGNDRIKALFDRENERAAEVAQYNNANSPQPVVVTSPSGDYDYYDHCVFVFKRNLSEADRGRFSDLVCRFGQKKTEKFQKAYLTNRKYFNYVEGKGITVNCPNNSRDLNIRMSDALNGGVRIWHTKPSSTYYVDMAANPNAS